MKRIKTRKRDFIGGNKISIKEALKDLGDPKTWPAFSKRVYRKFREVPGGVRPCLDCKPGKQCIRHHKIGPK